MSAKGNFEVDLAPQQDDGFAAGRMLISKTYQGDIVGTGLGQMISKRIEGGVAIYYAIEEFSGTVDGESGSFTLVHCGRMSSESQSLEVTILEGSGTAGLSAISGSMRIDQGADGHKYELTYDL